MSKEKLIYETSIDFGSSIKDFETLSNKFRDTRILTEKLRSQLSLYKAQLKELAKSEEVQTTEGKKRYASLIEKINETEQSLRQAKKTQTELNKTYDKLKLPTDSMARLRAETNALQATLDKHVKGVTITAQKYDKLKSKVENNRLAIINYDQSLNDGRTNVGRYAQSLQGLQVSFDKLLGGAIGIGGAISGIFALDTAITAIGDFNEQVKQTAIEQKKVEIAFRGSKEELALYRAEVKATATTFETEFSDVLEAATQLTSRFNTAPDAALNLIQQGLDNVTDKGKFLGLVSEELKKFTDIGIDDKSAIALLTQSSNLNINPDIFAEPLIKLREATPSTVDALEGAFGKKKTDEIFATFRKSPLEAIKMISEGMNRLDGRSSKTGALLADVFSSSGEDDVAMAKAISGISTELDNVSERTQKALDAQLDYEKAMSDFSEASLEISDSFSTLQLRVQTLIVQGLTAFVEIIKATPVFIRENKETIGGLLIAIAFLNFHLIQSQALILKDAAAKKINSIWTAASTAKNWLLTASNQALTTQISLAKAANDAMNNSLNFGNIKQAAANVLKSAYAKILSLTTIRLNLMTVAQKAWQLLLRVNPLPAFIALLKGGYSNILGVLTGKIKLATIAQRLFNIVMKANVIGIIVTVIAALVVAFIRMNDKSDTARRIFAGLSLIFKEIVFVVKVLIQGIFNFAKQYANMVGDVVKRSTFLTGVFERIRKVFNVVVNAIIFGFRELPAVLGGVSAVIHQVGLNIQGFFERIQLKAAIALEQIKRLATFDGNKVDAIDKEIARLKKQQEDLQKTEGKTLKEAFQAGFDQTKEAYVKLKSTAEKPKKETLDNVDDGTGDGGGSGSGDADKAAEKAKKIKEAEQRIQDLRIKLMKDETARRIAELESQAAREIEAIEASGEQKTEIEKLINEQLAVDIANVKKEATQKQAEKDLQAMSDAFELEKVLLTEQLAAAQITQQEHDDKLLQAQKDYTEKRIAATEKGSAAERELRTELSNLIIEEDSRAMAASIKLIDDYYNAAANKAVDAYNKEKIALQERYTNGEISYEEYQRQLSDIEDKFQITQLKAKKEHIEKLIELEDPTSARHAELLNELREIESESYKVALDQHRKFEEEKDKISDEVKEKRIEASQASLDLLTEINDAMLQIALRPIELERRAIEDSFDRKIKAAEGDEELQKSIKAQKEAQLEEIDAKERAIQRKSAARAKALAIAQATLDTFLAASKALASSPPPSPFGVIFAALAVASGMAQVAKIAATPLPKLARGGYYPSFREHSQGGTVVEMAKDEMAVTPKAGRNRKARSVTSFINSAFGGVTYPFTDMLPPVLRDSLSAYMGGMMPQHSGAQKFNMGMTVIPKMAQGGYNDGQTTGVSRMVEVNNVANQKADEQLALAEQQNQILMAILQKEGKISIDELGRAAKRSNTYEKFGKV